MVITFENMTSDGVSSHFFKDSNYNCFQHDIKCCLSERKINYITYMIFYLTNFFSHSYLKFHALVNAIIRLLFFLYAKKMRNYISYLLFYLFFRLHLILSSQRFQCKGPSSIYSCSISCIWGHKVYCLGHLGFLGRSGQ